MSPKKKKELGFDVLKIALPVIIAIMGFAYGTGAAENHIKSLAKDVAVLESKSQETTKNTIEIAILKTKFDNIDEKLDSSNSQQRRILEQLRKLNSK